MLIAPRRLPVVLIAFALVGLAWSARADAGEPVAVAPGACGKVTLTMAVGKIPASLTQQRTTCAKAKQVARRYANAPLSHCQGNSCYIEWKDGWACSSNSGTVWQQTGQMFRCDDGRAQIRARAPYRD
jgi:hypothetical protein